MDSGRYSFAIFQATQHIGPISWIIPEHALHTPLLHGLPDDVGDRILLIRPPNEHDLLWTIEETLRSPAIGLVIGEPNRPMSLTTGRRLQLAAEKGQTTGLMLIQNGQGSNASETRWKCTPIADHSQTATLHQWQIIKNKKGIVGNWMINWNGKTNSIHMVPETCQRHIAAKEADHRPLRVGS